jgi:hypothetical protein
VIHIQGLARKMICVTKMSDAGVHTLFQNDMCNMVKFTIVLMKGVRIGTLYKLLGNVDSIGCNSIDVPEYELNSTRIKSTQDDLIQTDLTSHRQIEPTMLWHERMGHIG